MIHERAKMETSTIPMFSESIVNIKTKIAFNS
jgi:hypothetical protein